MKKITLILFVALVSNVVYAQQGDFSAGVKGSYLTNYKNLLYGLDLSYHLSDPLEVSLSYMMNPSVTIKDEDGFSIFDAHYGLYSANLDLRYYLLHQRTWATGPILGGQYLYRKDKIDDYANDKEFGFNIGWRLRISLTDNLNVNGSWRYTNFKELPDYHAFSIGLCYTTNLF